MKRSSFITWDQLRVGLVIVAALGILTLAVYKLGQAANLFTKRYELVAFLKEANGLRVGGTVTLAGQLAGTVKRIDFLPVDADTTRNLKITVGVDQSLKEQIRTDSKAQIRTMGLLGDKIFDITPGTPRHPILKAGDTIAVSPALDYEQVLSQAAGAVGDVVALTHDMRQITSGIVRGEGTLGQLMTNRALYDQFTSTLTRTNAMLARVQNPNMEIVLQVVRSESQRHHRAPPRRSAVVYAAHDHDRVDGLAAPFGELGAGYVRQADARHRALWQFGQDQPRRRFTDADVDEGNGLASKLLTDQTLYDQLNKLVTDLNAVLADVRRDPARYMKGAIQIKVF